VKYKDFGKTIEVKLDTSKWQTGNGVPMTFSMGF
jgi:hypothetical protein